MSMDQVSLENYFNHPDLSKRENEVFFALKTLKRATTWQLLNHLGYKNPNFVRPRVSDLIKKCKVRKCEKVVIDGISQRIYELI